ncbi:transglycosylase SLT domain-containing protein [Streptomyces microflavus]|uniref:transglycosylase SLT domain-containing protein n=1 Tax=Streptomyces microflavus TaxID=1919 RepID=UPI0036BFF861
MATLTSLGFNIYSRYNGDGVRQARRDIGGLRGELLATDRSIAAATRRFNGLTVAAVAVAPALIPIAQVAGANAGALLAMGVSAGTALGVFGAAMGGAIKNTLSLRDNVSSLKQNLDQQKAVLATLRPGTEAYAKQLLKVRDAQKAYDAALRSMTPAQKAFIQSIDGLTAAWQKFITQTQDKSLGIASTVLGGLAVAVGKLKPLFDAVEPSMRKVGEALAGWLKGDGFERFIQVVIQNGVPALQALMNAGRSMATVLGEAFRAFAPMGAELANSLARGAAELAKWSQEGGFQRFLAEARTNTPAVREMLEALWEAFKNIMTAMKDLAPLSLALVTALAKIVAALPPGVIAAMAQAFVAWKVAVLGMMVITAVAHAFGAFVTAIGLVVKAIAAVKLAWLALQLAFIASPVGVVIAAIVALAAIFVVLWNKCEWFRNFWKMLWDGIKLVASAVWQWMQTTWDTVTNAFVTAWQAVAGVLGPAWAAVWNFIKGTANGIWLSLQQAWGVFVAIFGPVWQAVSAVFSVVWQATWTAIKVVAETVWAGIQAAWTVFTAIFAAVWAVTSTLFGPLWNVTWTVVRTVAEGVWIALTAAWNVFTAIFVAIWNVVSGVFQAAWNTTWTVIKTVVEVIWNGLRTLWNAFANEGILGVWNVVSTALSTAWNTVWNAIKTAAEAVWNALQVAWSAFVGALATAWTAVSAALSAAWNAVWNAIKTAAEAVWNALQIAWSAFINALATVWTTVSSALSAAWNAVWNAIRTAAEAVWNALRTAWQAFVSGLQTAWQAVSGALTAAWNAVWNALRTAAQAVWTAMQTAWNAFLNAVRTAWSTASSALSTAWNAVWNALRTAAQAVWTAMQTAWNAFLTAVRTVWTTFSTAITAAWNAFWNLLRTTAQTIWTAIRTAWQAFITAVTAAWNAFRTAITAAWSAFWNLLRTTAQTIWTAIRTAWQAFITAVTAAWNAFRTAIAAAWSTFWNLLRTTAQNVWNAIRQAWDRFIDGVKDAWTSASNWIKDKWSDTWNAVKDAARSIWNSIADVIEKAINGIIGLINGLTGGFNKVAEFLSVEIYIGKIGTVSMPRLANGGIVEFAYGGMTGGPRNLSEGGTIPGYAPGRDTIPAILSKGEGVLTPEAVRGLGGPGFVNGANRQFAGHRGAGGGAAPLNKWTADHDIQHMATGGMVGPWVPFAVGGMTADALRRAGVSLGMVSQGEYSHGSKSAGTHAGGGVVDISSTSSAVVARLREAGFAAWARTGAAWAGNEHIHAVLMNHPALSGPARAQVASFKAGGNGLGAGGGDGGGGGAPSWLEPLISKAGEIISRVAQGLDISGIFGGIFGGGGGGGDKKDEDKGGGLFGTGIGPDFGPDITPGDDLGDAVSKGVDLAKGFLGSALKMVIPGFGPLGKFLLGLIPDSAFEFGFKWITDKLKAFTPGAGGFGDMVIDMGSKAIKGAIQFLIGKNKEAAPEKQGMFSGGGGRMGNPAAVKARWGAMAAQALAKAGLPAGQLDRFLALMHAESGGNPGAANLWDSNAKMGQASRGLMQVIPSTFAAHRDKSLPNDILDPMANMVAAARYIKSRYGGNVPGSPYATGTNSASPGMHLVGERGPEMVAFGGGEKVFTAAQTATGLSALSATPTTPALPEQGMAASLEGKSFEDVMAAAQLMAEVVKQSWDVVVKQNTTSAAAMVPTFTEVTNKYGMEIPAAITTMQTTSNAAWADMNVQSMTQWILMRDTTFAEFELHMGTTVPAMALRMQTLTDAAWLQMQVFSTATWILMRDTTFAEFELHMGTTVPAMALAMQTAHDLAWTTMNATSTEQWTAIRDNNIIPFETHMQETMPAAAQAMSEAVGAAFTEMVSTIVEQLDTAIAKIEEFIAATEAAIAAAEALAAAQAAAAASGGGGGGALGGASGSAAEALARAGITSGMITQGPYSNSVSASAGTHSGGGVYDIASTSPTVLAALHAAGFAAWIRSGSGWAGNEHIHAVYSGANDLSPQARWQLEDFRRGGSGLGIPGNLYTGTPGANRGWNWVGEKGPELMKFRGGEKVTSTSDIHKRIAKFISAARRGGGGHTCTELGGRYRPVSFDNGGYLEPGYTVAHNGTGKPEPVGHNLGGGGDVNITIPIDVHGNLDPDAVRQIENEVIPKLRSLVQQGVGNGRR